ncbi:mycofactocin biosynthesis chaperone MftB [Nocardioides sp. CER19]|uniref:mycofactocin biosynthesis chaperone MftB n=1 Tax=Nocardioides sp. CER19 TaxID=3038538 RepID=UPI002447D874|nr:mycofactocin biosynthesis chaperone MftB [Nocardioides sp. CER19]MDH2416139.1 mycofactocin biosynthesis chaperone MftB [Nocardioides sp. CER19]
MVASGAEQARVDLAEAWELSPSVALRPEPFGALAYHFGNRKLTFLKRPDLVALVRALASAPSVASALDIVGISARQRAAYLDALSGLAATDMIRKRAS